MPKRMCPFECDLLPQLKVHVSEKEVNLGVLSASHMGLIYEKTIGLLFKGANHIDHQKHVQVNDGQRLPLPGQDHSKPSVRQMFLNYNCQLQKGGAELISTQQRATCCQNVETSSKCSFCDRGLCLSCTTLCSRCYEVFCDRCSLTVYTENEDTIMCMNCCR